MDSSTNFFPFRDLPLMGVIYVVSEAVKLGYAADNPAWANLGQGQPEVGNLPGAPERFSKIEISIQDNAYGPVEGLPELRARVAEHYNRLYRRGLKSQYQAENVAIAAGGRTTLARTFAALDQVRLGYFIPDYTAYEDLLTTFQRVKPHLIMLHPEEKFAITATRLENEVKSNQIQALLISNPCNPTGRVIAGSELNDWLSVARKNNCAILADEYYSHYIWDNSDAPVSFASQIEDVNRDRVVLIDGLTKNYRYPGWRLGWAVGPREMVRKITAAGSFIDGGPPRPMQRAAFEVLEPQRADQETAAMRKAFFEKRNLLVNQLSELGVKFPLAPQGTFYAYGSVADLPAPLNDGMTFFREALKHQVMTVPGEFFDVNPYKLRQGRSPFSQFVRFSYGPPKNIMLGGLSRLAQMIKSKT